MIRKFALTVAVLLTMASVMGMASDCGGSQVRPDRRPASPAPTTSQFMGTKN